MTPSNRLTPPLDDDDDALRLHQKTISRYGSLMTDAISHPGMQEPEAGYGENGDLSGLDRDDGEDVDEPYADPAPDPAPEIEKARLDLKTKISEDRKIDWEDEAAWEAHPNYEEYRKDVASLIRIERDYLAGTSSDESPINFLQYVLQEAPRFYPYLVGPQKAKFLLQLIFKFEPVDLSPKYGPRLLHAAVTADIEVMKHAPQLRPDITIYLCKLMKDQAAEGICEVNDAKQNILHLAILHDLRGVEGLIKMAGRRAFIEQRSTGDSCDGNTPLHDALDMKKFIRPVPTCQIPTPILGPPAVAARNATWPSVAQWPVTISDIPGAPQAQEPPIQVVSNQSRPRESATSIPQSRQVRITPSYACKTCIAVHRQNKAVLEKVNKIIDLLLKQAGGEEALTIHNSAGLSPYLYLYTSYHERAEKRCAKSRSDVVNGQSPLLTQGINTAAGVMPINTGPRRKNTEHTGENAIEGGSSHLQLEKVEKEKKQAQRLDPPIQGQGEGAAGAADAKGNHNIGGVAGPRNNSRAPAHSMKTLRQKEIGCKEVLDKLWENSFRLGGYKKACDCLFRNQSVKRSPYWTGELERQWQFSLEGDQRVQSNTTRNFNFLKFETTMASVVLSLEYSQEVLDILPKDDQEKAEIWAKDEENLKRVFEWLKTTKGVKTILSLTVKDNPDHYCSDDTVEECLRGLEVMYLNWNRPDLCANRYTLPPTLVEVSLHWSGLNSVLWSWSATEGLQTLEKLQRVYIYIRKGTELEDRSRKVKVAQFQDRVKKWQKRKPILITVRNDDRAFREGGKSRGLNSLQAPVHPWLKHVSGFCDKLFTLYHNQSFASNTRPRRVKIALLDDGVDPTYERNGENLHHAGWPPIYSGEPEPGPRSFYVSTDQHGSKMAWLIRQVCPFVTIYVAKLDVESGEDPSQRSFNLSQATKAILWAIKQKVDIISMSWNVCHVSGRMTAEERDEIKNFEAAITEAAREDILVFGAACDVKQSTPSDTWVPCGNQNVFSIGATDMDFDVKKYVNLNKKVDYLFPGEHILSRIEDADAGNSGATALAAGLAALVFFCMLAEGEALPIDRRVWMKNVFAKVFDGEMNKVVHVKDVLRLDDQGGILHLVKKFAAQKD
ncbi:hypothetical protein GGS23DRAFT_581183 [Durotheca rogersii]|uniref:uncharacterized protein n=1 Tax=Durotheca rogersii TaxID=419775 RepID=UPI00221F72C5|nr:uncharacterized protein GGS23DRAFT_581183 [Durotheca rogersii]KAI5860379.1 hypothetical protein GGS23DRAFT_581183 [Durotheca rogersii]